MIRFSANLGFLWQELALPDAIQAASDAGFHAVECHWPYDVPAEDTKAALDLAGLRMLGLNTRRGDVSAGDNGVAAIPGREAEAREYIDEAIAYASAIGCANVHVMAGVTDQSARAEAVFQENLHYASMLAETAGIGILIEPLNARDAPGYHLHTVDAGLATINALARTNVKLMFDCYHIQIMQGDLTKRIEAALPSIGHIQIAGVPDRGEPNRGEVNYPELMASIEVMGWSSPIGAEYKPKSSTADGLRWMEDYR